MVVIINARRQAAALQKALAREPGGRAPSSRSRPAPLPSLRPLGGCLDVPVPEGSALAENKHIPL